MYNCPHYAGIILDIIGTVGHISQHKNGIIGRNANMGIFMVAAKKAFQPSSAVAEYAFQQKYYKTIRRRNSRRDNVNFSRHNWAYKLMGENYGNAKKHNGIMWSFF